MHTLPTGVRSAIISGNIGDRYARVNYGKHNSGDNPGRRVLRWKYHLGRKAMTTWLTLWALMIVGLVIAICAEAEK
jgi:hypothetical protein